MKIAVNYTGHAPFFCFVAENNIKNFLNPNNCDIFVTTSSAVSQRKILNKNAVPFLEPKGPVFEYLPKGSSWRAKALEDYGIIYNIEVKSFLKNIKQAYVDHLKQITILEEDAFSLSNDYGFNKWLWLKNNQINKQNYAYKQLVDYELQNKIKYEIIVHSRMDLIFNKNIDIEDIIKQTILATDKDIDNTIFLFHGWRSNKYSKIGIFDGFIFGGRTAMKCFYNLSSLEQPFEYEESYKQHVLTHGVNIEYQIFEFLKQNNVNICNTIIEQEKSKKFLRKCFTIKRE